MHFVDTVGIGRARAIRTGVFVDELGITRGDEYDDRDERPGTVHFLAVDDGADVGTVRLVPEFAGGAAVHVTRVAVRRAARGRGVGRALMDAVERFAWHDHAVGSPRRVRLLLSVMEPAVPFYEALGYTVEEASYPEVGIPHHRAHKELVAPPG